MKLVRSFICVEINNPDLVSQINAQLKDFNNIEGVKTVKSNQLHLTLKFLGEVSEKQLTDIKAEILQIKFPPFNIKLEKIGFFPNLKRIRVIWIGISNGREELKQFAHIIEESLIKIGFPEEKRSYSPHLTLARVKYLKEEGKKTLIHKIKEKSGLDIGTQHIDRFILKKSVLTPKGAIYEDLLELPLSNT